MIDVRDYSDLLREQVLALGVPVWLSSSFFAERNCRSFPVAKHGWSDRGIGWMVDWSETGMVTGFHEFRAVPGEVQDIPASRLGPYLSDPDAVVDAIETVVNAAPADHRAGILLETLYRLQAIREWCAARTAYRIARATTHQDDGPGRDPSSALAEASARALRTTDPVAELDAELALLGLAGKTPDISDSTVVIMNPPSGPRVKP